ncbi:MAG: protoheme IX farnesyltransferase [Lentimicrobium sp.]|nr:protoheme IX farnesyltransferase [Lentimicrobium sp.]
MKITLKAYAAVLAQLCKFRISVAVALTTFTGYLMSHGELSRGIVFPFLGVFLLASAASALNQVQEAKTDLLMTRTKNRPLPSGRITRREAIRWVFLLALAGIFLLWFFNGWIAAFLGALTFLWYNGIYTPLKRVSAFAAVPGGVVGALPPVIGWVSGGGSLFDPAAIALGLFFFIGQVPHFWILLLKYGEEYELAGLKSLTTELSHLQIRRITFMWIAATSVSAFLLPGFYFFNYKSSVYLLWVLSAALVLVFIRLVIPSVQTVRLSSSFVIINLYYFLIMILFCMDVLIKYF